MEFTITRDKNFYIFQSTDTPRCYRFDINTATMYGRRKKPLATYPVELKNWVHNHYYSTYGNRAEPVLYYLFHVLNDYYYIEDAFSNGRAETLGLIDKMVNVGYKFQHDNPYNIPDYQLAFIRDNFKAFVKMIKDDPNISLYHFYEDYSKVIFFDKYNLKIDDHFTEEMVSWLYRNRDNYTEEQISWLIYYMRHGLWDLRTMCAVPNVCSEGSTIDIFKAIRAYFKMCDLNGMKYQTDWYRHFPAVKRTYIVNQQKIEREQLEKHYGRKRKALAFANDKFEIVIPEAVDDFRKEADAQQNCVFSIYLPKVQNGETYVVFVRQKDTLDKSFITCEVSLRGCIRQYLARFNNRVEDRDALDFCKAYQDYLTENWDKD